MIFAEDESVSICQNYDCVFQSESSDALCVSVFEFKIESFVVEDCSVSTTTTIASRVLGRSIESISDESGTLLIDSAGVGTVGVQKSEADFQVVCASILPLTNFVPSDLKQSNKKTIQNCTLPK
jgi:hypothetical protein